MTFIRVIAVLTYISQLCRPFYTNRDPDYTNFGRIGKFSFRSQMEVDG